MILTSPNPMDNEQLISKIHRVFELMIFRIPDSDTMADKIPTIQKLLMTNIPSRLGFFNSKPQEFINMLINIYAVVIRLTESTVRNIRMGLGRDIL